MKPLLPAIIWTAIVWLLIGLAIGLILNLTGCAYYDGFGWQPCAGYTHNAHDSYNQ